MSTSALDEISRIVRRAMNTAWPTHLSSVDIEPELWDRGMAEMQERTTYPLSNGGGGFLCCGVEVVPGEGA